MERSGVNILAGGAVIGPYDWALELALIRSNFQFEKLGSVAEIKQDILALDWEKEGLLKQGFEVYRWEHTRPRPR